MSIDPLRIMQISDTHLFGNEKEELLGVNTDQSFRTIVELIKQEQTHIDLILLSGDLSQDGTTASYLRIAEIIKTFKVPVYCIPGNHDDPKVMNQVYPVETISNHRHIVLKNWHLILLDSHIEKSAAGALNSSQLSYLQHCLQTYPEHQAIIAFHHHPFNVGSKWLDNIGLKNADEFWKIIAGYPKVHTVLFGHVHQECEQMLNGIYCYATPSTCIQFMPKQDQFGLENVPQGYRWLELYDDGTLKTGISRVSEYIGHFDKNATGY